MSENNCQWRNSLTDLPQNVLMEILSRVPWKTLIACKCVCRIFNDLAASSSKLTNASPPAVVMMRQSTRHLHLFDPEVDPPILSSLKSFTKFPFPVPKFEDQFRITLVNSCNGLLYLVSRCANEPDSIIFNPLTNEYFSVPCCGSVEKFAGIRVLGFSALVNKYKVLSISPSPMGLPFDVKIHDVGSELWRAVETGHGVTLVSEEAIYLNGVAYMFPSVTVVYFDFDKEELGEIALPNELTVAGSYLPDMDIGVLGGCLCIHVSYYQRGKKFLKLKRFDLWVMREDTWSKEFVTEDSLISNFRLSANLRPFQVLSSGEILVLWEGHDWFCYHPKHKTLRFLGLKKLLKDPYVFLNNFVPSFVSLKDQLWVDNGMVQRGISRFGDDDEYDGF